MTYGHRLMSNSKQALYVSTECLVPVSLEQPNNMQAIIHLLTFTTTVSIHNDQIHTSCNTTVRALYPDWAFSTTTTSPTAMTAIHSLLHTQSTDLQPQTPYLNISTQSINIDTLRLHP
jgi:hypothetical protein